MSDCNNFSKRQSQPVSQFFEDEWNRIFGKGDSDDDSDKDDIELTSELIEVDKPRRFTGWV